jgi:hypothetical protein
MSHFISKLQFALSYHDPLYTFNVIECNINYKITKKLHYTMWPNLQYLHPLPFLHLDGIHWINNEKKRGKKLKEDNNNIKKKQNKTLQNKKKSQENDLTTKIFHCNNHFQIVDLSF